MAPYLLASLEDRAIPVCFTLTTHYLADNTFCLRAHAYTGLVADEVPTGEGHIAEGVTNARTDGVGKAVHGTSESEDSK